MSCVATRRLDRRVNRPRAGDRAEQAVGEVGQRRTWTWSAGHRPSGSTCTASMPTGRRRRRRSRRRRRCGRCGRAAAPGPAAVASNMAGSGLCPPRRPSRRCARPARPPSAHLAGSRGGAACRPRFRRRCWSPPAHGPRRRAGASAAGLRAGARRARPAPGRAPPAASYGGSGTPTPRRKARRSRSRSGGAGPGRPRPWPRSARRGSGCGRGTARPRERVPGIPWSGTTQSRRPRRGSGIATRSTAGRSTGAHAPPGGGSGPAHRRACGPSAEPPAAMPAEATRR